MSKFQFEIGAAVALSMSDEKGQVIGRAEYANQPPQYWVRYVAADGRQCEAWFDSEAIR